MLPFTTVAIAIFNKQTVFPVSCDGPMVVRNVVVSVSVVELEGGWLWSLGVVPMLLEGVELKLVGVELLQMLV